jgi:thiol-disulfide isomerase/thioredoxin
MISKERLAVLGVVVLTAALAAWFLRDNPRPESMEPHPAPGDARPAASPRPVTLRGGATRDLASRPGKLLVVHFWATWCPPCVEELPGLLEWAKSVRSDPRVEVLAVSVDTDWKAVDDFLKRTGASDLSVALDPRRSTAKAFGTEKFPETWFLSPEGKVLESFIGPVEWNRPETRKRLAQLQAMVAAPAAAEAK